MDLLSLKQQEALLEIINHEKLFKYTIQVSDNHEKGNNYMGKIIKIKIEGINANNQNEAKNFVMKVAPVMVNLRKIIPITLCYTVETVYYTKILPVLKDLQEKYMKDGEKFQFINCYKVNEEELEEFLIMDDVTVDDYKLEPRTKPLSLHHIKLAIQHIAYLHSLSFALNKYAPELLSKFISLIDYTEVYLDKAHLYNELTLTQTIMYTNDERNKQILEKLCKDVGKKITDCLTPSLSEPYNVLCHGDCWQNNILFKSKSGNPIDVIFLDWQLGKYCSPHIDLLHFIFSASDATLRRNHYHELIDLYYNTLKVQLRKMGCDVEEMYPEHIYREHIKLMAPYALVYSIISANLLVRQDDDIPDMEVILKDGVIPDGDVIKYSNKRTIDDFVERVNGLISDFLELGLM